MRERRGGRTVFFLALAAQHRDGAARLAARFVDNAEIEAKTPVPRIATPAEFLFVSAERGGGPQCQGVAEACALHGVTWDEVVRALAVLRRLVRL